MKAWSEPDPGAARARLAVTLSVLLPVLDVVHEPPDSALPPAWCRRRGWETFLLAIDDGVLAACERGDWSALCASAAVPDELRQLVADVERTCGLPRLRARPVPLPEASLRGVSARKREQLSALLGVVSPMALRAERIVDIGSGSGHLSRLAAELFGRTTWAVDRDPERARVGSLRAERRAQAVGGLELEFSIADVLQEAPSLGSADLAIGLHACGELGDALVRLAAEAGCDLVLLSCCLQKIRGPTRAALSRAGAGLALRRDALGLTNLTPQSEGVETSLTETLHARETRYALRQLLRARGLAIAPGAEMRGVNRRRARSGLDALAARALARRSLPAASREEIRRFERAAASEYAALRRLALPRSLLGRLVELSVVLDRAAALEERGRAVLVAQSFDPRVTPRNLALFAASDAERLPDLEA